jgi:hypothetical protein
LKLDGGANISAASVTETALIQLDGFVREDQDDGAVETAPFTGGVHAAPSARAEWAARFLAVRKETERRAAPLSAEDQMVQSMPDASPIKWHRAHTTWFLEQFLVEPNRPGYQPYDPRFYFLFNSYYVQAGPRHARFQRGLITRPSTEEVGAYRARIDALVLDVIATIPESGWEAFRTVLEVGLHHEQQHQELMFTDILHAFAQNPTSRPVSSPSAMTGRASASTTNTLATTCCCRRARSVRSSPMASGCASWRTAAIAGPNCGSRTAGPPCPKAGRRRAIGARSPAPGTP